MLAVLAALSTGFYTIMLMQTKSATRYSDSVRAEMMAKAGVDFAIASLRDQAFRKTEDAADPWYPVNYYDNARRQISFADAANLHNNADDDGDGIVDNPSEARLDPNILGYSRTLGDSAGIESDRFTLNISDAASRININACDNLAVVLDNLCRVIGPPLVAAELDAIQPRRWGVEMEAGDPALPFYDNTFNKDDLPTKPDLYYQLTNNANAVVTNGQGRPRRKTDGRALYGDGYAIAGYRGTHGLFQNLEDVKQALTYVERSSPPNNLPDDPLEQLEIEVKYAVLRDHITIASWVDTNTVCVGKFEWVHVDSSKTIAIDRDKSWVADDLVKDPLNLRGSLRGSYVSILNGHGAGQLRRIRTNGVDWIEVEGGFAVAPGPISSYMIIANEDALLQDKTGAPISAAWPDKPPTEGMLTFPRTNVDGTLVDNPLIDYSLRPLCIHRAPVNINTATDKVLAALFLNINVQHGHSLALGTDADVSEISAKWYMPDKHGIEPVLLTANGLKRLPANSGKPVFNNTPPVPPAASNYVMAYLNNYGAMDRSNYGPNDKIAQVNAVQKLVYRILIARQPDKALPYIDPKTGDPSASGGLTAYKRGPFRTWDDFFFRVVKPFDEEYFKAAWTDANGDGIPNEGDDIRHAHLARLIMANFNSNTDILKFNPNIEWIDRFGRNFTEQEPIMIYTDNAEPHNSNVPVADPISSKSIPIYTTADSNLKSSQRDKAGNFIRGAYITRNYRYKSDELIDKTDLNRSTTEFSFDSNGIFEIESVGQVMRKSEVLAERKFMALVKVYDVWRESTQQQFVQGKISKAVGNYGTAAAGQIARDAENIDDRLALNTLPEPLVPLKTRIVDQKKQKNPNNKEVVSADKQPRDAYGEVRSNPYDSGAAPEDVPDVIANRIQPARYDGQITLATNTMSYDPTGDGDTFLASFDGDLDTAVCKGNGREQAKTPADSKVRVVDAVGLLGVLNDTQRDMDPGLPLANPGDPVNGYRWVYKFFGVNAGLKPLKEVGADPNRPYYWNNVTLRTGDLRPEGAYLSSPGVSGNDATVKYLFGANKENFKPDSTEGNIVSMWAKSTWHHDDFRHHEFFNASNDGERTHNARGCYIAKYGQYTWCLADDNPWIGHSGNRTKINDLMCFWENNASWGLDLDMGSLLHGGHAYVTQKFSGESPSFRIQPFRWSFIGGRRQHYSSAADGEGDGPRGHWVPPPNSGDFKNQKNLTVVKNHVRPFIDTQLHPEGATTWKPDQFWSFRTTGRAPVDQTSDIGNAGAMDPLGRTGQDVKWEWAEPVGKNNQKCFGINNLNYGHMGPVTNPDQVSMHYRFMPDDGTYAVIDELKISSKDRGLGANPDWANDRVVRESRTSRYYLPPDPASRQKPDAGGPPTFTSQTMLQSLKGFDKKKSNEKITVVRVNWNAFTPRFMCEYKTAEDDRFVRDEKLTYDRTTQNNVKTRFKGPFDYVKYNDPADTSFYSVDRPAPTAYPLGQVQAYRGVEIEILKDPDGYNESGDEIVLDGKTFTEPDQLNSLGTALNPHRLYLHELRYRVRFRYPTDPLCDPMNAGRDSDGKPCVDPAKQYLLDTPVFDDISVTYLAKPKILSYVEVQE
ncbi:MAG TPA: hypothetical protein VEK08_12920 [Planctomycetota bacterium]|nr:hypothetical protein [Planctomycetota bacterium]